MYIGADYYPEHWPRERWSRDAVLMRKAGFNVVRLAEFAWVNMEPVEGRFDFEWLDEALRVLAKENIAAILGTPTAVMPAWAARAYPETLAADKDGKRIAWGVRKNNCFASGAYRLLSERITAAMAGHFARTPNVIGWQTDNEFGGPICFCDTCVEAFRDWLRAKYKTLAALNQAWGTHFWGHNYGMWSEVVAPVEPGGSNPGLLLDWQRFSSWLNVRFQRDQVLILRRLCPRHFVTHNFMGTFSDLEYFDLAEDLDFVSWDNYPVWGKPAIRYEAAYSADIMRGLKKKNFWIMEQSSGPGGWSSFARNPWPGEIRGVAYQQVAHGADATIWFRWRTCTAGREQYWHGLLGHDGIPARRYREAARTTGEFQRLSRMLAGTTPQPRLAMIYDYDSIWALRFQPGFEHNNYHQVQMRYYEALFRAGLNVDIIRATDDFSAYRAIIASDLHVLPDAVALALTRFVKAGGVLVADCRTGVKTENNLCHERTLPGLLSAPLGIKIEEYEAIADGLEFAVAGANGFDGCYTAVHYADWVMPGAATVLAGYEHWHLQPFAALTRHRFGKGLGYYVGAIFKEAAFYDALIAEVCKHSRIKPVVRPPAGVEVSLREGAGRKLLFLINHTDEEKEVAVPAGKRELLSGKTSAATLTLKTHGVAVLRLA